MLYFHYLDRGFSCGKLQLCQHPDVVHKFQRHVEQVLQQILGESTPLLYNSQYNHEISTTINLRSEGIKKKLEIQLHFEMKFIDYH